MDTSPTSQLSTALQTVGRSELQQRVADFREALLAEVLGVAADAVAESLGNIDKVLNECLVVPRLRYIPPADVPRIIEATVPLPLRARVLAAWQRDREITAQRAREAQRRHRPVETLAEPKVAVVGRWDVPELKTTERRLVPLEQ